MTRKHRETNLGLKLKCLRLIEKGEKQTDICQKYNVRKSTLSTWKKQKEKYYGQEQKGISSKVLRVRKCGSEQIQSALIQWVQFMRQKNANFTTEALEIKGKE